MMQHKAEHVEKHECHARRYSDTMICDKCGLQWDVNDPEPPPCRKPETGRERGLRNINLLRERWFK